MRQGRRLGVDVGSARVGLAVCDADGVLATPVATVQRRSEPAGGAADAGSALPAAPADIDEIVAAAAEFEAVEVVVGLPRSLSGAEGPAAVTARAYAKSLADRLEGVPVRLLDERLTTVDAQRALRAAGRSAREQRAVIDQVAAVLILQAALDLERASGRPPGEAVGGRKRRHGRQGRPARQGQERRR